MDGSNFELDAVYCCFCKTSASLKKGEVVTLLLLVPNDGNQQDLMEQNLYCHRRCLRDAVHSSIPLVSEVA